jgi:hypothetical protein
MSKQENQAAFLSISFGNSGGFTGAVNEYILNEDGGLYKVILHQSGADTLFKLKLEKQETSYIFNRISDDTIKQIELNEAGNFTYFIALVKNRAILSSYHWTDISDVPVQLKALYERLNGHVKDL